MPFISPSCSPCNFLHDAFEKLNGTHASSCKRVCACAYNVPAVFGYTRFTPWHSYLSSRDCFSSSDIKSRPPISPLDCFPAQELCFASFLFLFEIFVMFFVVYFNEKTNYSHVGNDFTLEVSMERAFVDNCCIRLYGYII